MKYLFSLLSIYYVVRHFFTTQDIFFIESLFCLVFALIYASTDKIIKAIKEKDKDG